MMDDNLPSSSALGKEITLETEQEVSDCPSSEDDICQTRHHETPPPPTKALPLLDTLKTVVSAVLLLVCLTMLMSALWTRQTRATSDDYGWPPLIACVLFWLVLAWLAVIEGGLNCQVGLKPLDRVLYESTHPLAARATNLCVHGKNLERFIVGRQYMDLSMVFAISFLCTPVDQVSVLGLPRVISFVFLNTGLAMTLVTIVLGQLTLQINAANCMLDYMNNLIMLGSTYLALLVESSGVCHVVYLIQRIVARAKQKTTPSQKPLCESIVFWLRVVLSTILLLFCLCTIVVASLRQQTKMFVGVPPWLSLVLLVGLIILVGLLDALQVALMAVVHMPAERLEHSPTALSNAQFVMEEPRRLSRFLLGRQIGQTVVQFLLARITTLNVPLGTGEGNIWGVTDTLQRLFNMGILGAIIATVLASLTWRVLASEYPVAFLSLRVSRPLIVACLAAEQTGVINISWKLAALHRNVVGIRPDEYYLGGKQHGDGDKNDDLENQAATDSSKHSTIAEEEESSSSQAGRDIPAITPRVGDARSC